MHAVVHGVSSWVTAVVGLDHHVLTFLLVSRELGQRWKRALVVVRPPLWAGLLWLGGIRMQIIDTHAIKGTVVMNSGRLTNSILDKVKQKQ